MISSVKNAFIANYNDIMDGTFNNELLNVSDATKIVSLIRENIEEKYIYYCNNIVKTKLQSYRILNILLDRFVPCVFNKSGKENADDQDSLLYKLMSINYRFICEKTIKEKEYFDPEAVYYKLLLVTDFVAGMTDTYAMNM